MSDEEKKAIEELKEEINKPVEVPEDKFDTFILYNIESAKTILSLIEKQSKEIEELKEKNEYLPAWVGKKYVSKEESEQRERKAYIKGTNDADELCNKKWEDKIKAKIEEVNAEELNLAFIISGVEYKEAITSALQSLLEKE